MKKWLLSLPIIIAALILADSFSPFGITSSMRSASLGLARLIGGNAGSHTTPPLGDPTVLERYAALADTAQLEKENQDLRAVLNFQKKTQKQLRIANVLYRDALVPSYFYIDIGSRDGIRAGQAVVTPDGFLIGKIAAIYNATAQVERVSNTAFKVAASVLHESSTAGLLRGNNGPLLLLELIPPNRELMKEDVVVTANTDAAVPEGLLIGTIQTIDNTTDPLFHSASILPFFPSEQLPRIVSIIVPE